MEALIGSFEDLAWDSSQPGVREKKIEIGGKVVRILKLTGEFSDEDWCVKGHTGYVLEGSFYLDINGTKSELSIGDVFDVSPNNPAHRHIPIVESGSSVTLLLVEERDRRPF